MRGSELQEPAFLQAGDCEQREQVWQVQGGKDAYILDQKACSLLAVHIVGVHEPRKRNYLKSLPDFIGDLDSSDKLKAQGDAKPCRQPNERDRFSNIRWN